MNTVLSSEVFGEYEYTVTDVNSGNVVNAGSFKNVITVNGVNLLIASRGGSVPMYCSIGTGTSSFTENSTGLTTGVYNNASIPSTGVTNVTISGVNYSKHTITWNFSALSTTYDISEVAVYLNNNPYFTSSYLFSIARITDSSGNPTAIHLLGSNTSTPQQLTLSYSFYVRKIPAGTSLGSGSISVNSVPINYNILTTSERDLTYYPNPGNDNNDCQAFNVSNVLQSYGPANFSGTYYPIPTANPKEFSWSYSANIAPGVLTCTFRYLVLFNGDKIVFDADITKSSIQRMQFTITKSLTVDNTSISIV